MGRVLPDAPSRHLRAAVGMTDPAVPDIAMPTVLAADGERYVPLHHVAVVMLDLVDYLDRRPDQLPRDVLTHLAVTVANLDNAKDNR